MSAQSVVRHNVDTLLHLFEEVKSRPKKKATRFKTWIDPKTGELQFSEEKKELKEAGKRHWQELHIAVIYDEPTGRVLLEEKEPSGIDLGAKALGVFQETIQVMKRFEKTLPCRVNLADYLFINQIWHHWDRLQAEEALLKKPVGTYLCRQDRFAIYLEEKLRQEKGKRVSLWTLSVLQAPLKCSDFTIVHYKNRWQIYNDDLSFDQPSFATLSELIRHSKHLFRYPLYKR